MSDALMEACKRIDEQSRILDDKDAEIARLKEALADRDAGCKGCQHTDLRACRGCRRFYTDWYINKSEPKEVDHE